MTLAAHAGHGRAPDARSGSLRLTERSLDVTRGRAVFGFDLDGERFEEVLELPPGPQRPPSGPLDLALDICHVVMGTSYFKLTAPGRLVIDRPVPPEVVQVARLAYDDGMREFAVRNGLPVPLVTDIVADVREDAMPPAPATAPLPPTGDGALAPIGGGKDSAAVLTLLPRATGFSVSPTPAQRRLAAAAGVPLLEARRHLDPHLGQATARPGAMNGHIPVTAVNSAVSVLAALLHGYRAVVMGNERSASEPTRLVGSTPVNHQFSKSLAMEAALQRAFDGTGVAYFSMLRQLSELSIAGIVARSPLRADFLSCNRAFRLSRATDSPQHWCLECPKCLFTFLCFAVHTGPEDAEPVFGGNPLAREGNIAGFRDLWSGTSKPFDCVGERAESALAMARLAEGGPWSGFPVVRALGQEAALAARDMGAGMEATMAPGGPHLMPREYAALASSAALEAPGR